MQSSARALGIKNLGSRDKDVLITLVANGLLKHGFVKFVGNPENPMRDDVKKIKLF